MDAQIVQELTAIRSLVTVVVWVAVILAIVIVAAMAVNYRINLQHIQTGDFSTRGNTLLMKGELDKLLKLCKKHLLEFPADAGAHWLKGTAHYRRKEWNEALLCYRKADELQPGYAVGPSISEIEEKTASAETSPDLKVVAPVTPIHSPVSSKDGPSKGVDA